jgi:putative DNA primase/helicase
VLPAETDVESAVGWGWAKFCVSTEAESLAPTTQALDNIRRWIAERWNASLKGIGSSHPINTRDAVGWYDDDAIHVPRAHIAEAADHVLGEQAIVKLLVTGDCLAARHSGKRAAVLFIKGVGRVTAYALRRDKFGPEAKP